MRLTIGLPAGFFFFPSLNQLIEEAIDCQSSDLSKDIIVFLYLN